PLRRRHRQPRPVPRRGRAVSVCRAPHPSLSRRAGRGRDPWRIRDAPPDRRTHACAERGGRGGGKLRSAARWALIFAVIIVSCVSSAAQAACTGVVAGRLGPMRLVAAVPEGAVSITFLGHSSFLIESPAGVRIVTDYNDAIRAPVTPDVVTMNNAHPT